MTPEKLRQQFKEETGAELKYFEGYRPYSDWLEQKYLALLQLYGDMTSELCGCCGEPTNSWQGNPGRWKLMLPYRSEPGVLRAFHYDCILKLLPVAAPSPERVLLDHPDSDPVLGERIEEAIQKVSPEKKEEKY